MSQNEPDTQQQWPYRAPGTIRLFKPQNDWGTALAILVLASAERFEKQRPFHEQIFVLNESHVKYGDNIYLSLRCEFTGQGDDALYVSVRNNAPPRGNASDGYRWVLIPEQGTNGTATTRMIQFYQGTKLVKNFDFDFDQVMQTVKRIQDFLWKE